MGIRFAAVLLVVLENLAASTWLGPEGAGWQKTASLPPWQPHTGSIAVPLSTGSTLLIAGQAGRHGGATFDCFNCTSEVWNFDHHEATWTNLSQDVPWDPRWGHSAVTMPDDTVWMLFGCCERGKPTVMLRDVWTYNPTAGTGWLQQKTEPPFEGIQATSAAVLGTDIWVTGGWSQHRGTLSQVAVLHTDTLKWTLVSKNGEVPWETRADHATAISPDGRWLVLFGGQHAEDGGRRWNRCKDTWRVALPAAKATSWERLGDLREARSSPSVMVLPTGWLVTLGGHWTPDQELLQAEQDDVEGMQEHHEATEFKIYSDVLALDLNTGSKEWKVVEMKAAWPARDDAAATCSADGTILIFGGGTLYGGGGYHQDVWRLENSQKVYGLLPGKTADEL